MVLRDPAVKLALRDLYVAGWYEYLPQVEAGLTPFAAVTDRAAEARAVARAPRSPPAPPRRPPASPSGSTSRPCSWCSSPTCGTSPPLDRDLGRYTLVGGASIYPFAWNLLLAAHAEGLGGVLTTMPIRREPAVQGAARRARPGGRRRRAGPRVPGEARHPTHPQPVESFATVDRYDGPEFTGA